MASDLLPVLIGILLVLVPGAAVVLALRTDRVAAALRIDLDARLTVVDATLGTLEAELRRNAASIREEASRLRAEDREVVRSGLARLADALNLRISELSEGQRERLDTLTTEIARGAADSEQ